MKETAQSNGRALAYEIIYKKIVSGEMPAGTVTSVNELIKITNLGRSPIRDAILQLNDQGLVQVVPQKGIFIVGIRAKDVKEMFQLRLAIEFLALDNIIKINNKQNLIKLHKILEKQESTMLPGSQELFPKLDEDFHFFIINTLNNGRINRILEESRRQMALYGYNAITAHKNIEESVKEHKRILEFIEQGNADEAKREMENHLIKAQNSVLLS